MSSTGDLRAYQAGFCVEGIGINLLQSFAAKVVVAITGGSSETGLTDTVLLHGADNLHLVVFCSLIKFLKTFFQGIFHRFTEIVNCRRDSKLCI